MLMRLALFKLRLLLFLGFFVAQVVLTNFRQLKTVFTISILTLVVLVAATTDMQLARLRAEKQQITTIVLEIPGSKKQTFTRDQVISQITQYEKLLKEQPQQRTVLINLALLYSALDDTAAAQQKWDQARALDPNHPAFTQ